MNYFLFRDGQKHGPYTKTELAEKSIAPNDLLWAEGMVNWVNAADIEEIRDIITAPPLIQQKPPCPKTWLAASIIATAACAICCSPMALCCAVGICKAADVTRLYNNGLYEEAEEKAKSAKKWGLYPAFIAIAFYALCIVAFLIIELHYAYTPYNKF